MCWRADFWTNMQSGPKAESFLWSEDSESLLDFPYRCHTQIYKSPSCLMSQLRFCLICFIHVWSHWFMPAALDACQKSFIIIRAHQKNADISGMVVGIDGTQLPIPPGTKIVLVCKSRAGGHCNRSLWWSHCPRAGKSREPIKSFKTHLRPRPHLFCQAPS